MKFKKIKPSAAIAPRRSEAVAGEQASRPPIDEIGIMAMELIDEAPPLAAPTPAFRMRLAPGIHAVSGDEIEIRVDGARIAGGNGVTEFNLWVETWVEIHVLR